jgi:polysaccharide biosynthesis transport protein
VQRFKEVSITSGVSESQVSIVDRAVTPKLPYAPRLRNALVQAVFLAFALGIGLALLAEYIDDTIKSPEDVKAKLGLSVIGVVPKVPAASSVLEELENVKSAISEAFGSARTALHFSTPAGAPRTLLITGNRPAEGKTSCATGLALAFARIGKRVLVIDADMRRPSFAPGAATSMGLSGLLTNAAPLADHIITGSIEGVALLPAGVLPPNPAELLAGHRFSDILIEAQAQYDLVIVDAPPVMDFADAPLLASACEATVLAVQAAGVRRPLVRRTVERLVSANAYLVGVMLTKYDLKRSGYGYGYGYGYNYRYGEGKTDSVSVEARQRRRITIFGASDDDPTDGRN